MKIKPLYDRVVLKKLPQACEKLGNIILPEITKRPEICEVVELGVGKLDGKDVEFVVKVGDKVIFDEHLGSEFKIKNETYTIINEKDILAIIENKEDQNA